MLRFMGSQRVGHNQPTELNRSDCLLDQLKVKIYIYLKVYLTYYFFSTLPFLCRLEFLKYIIFLLSKELQIFFPPKGLLLIFLPRQEYWQKIFFFSLTFKG